MSPQQAVAFVRELSADVRAVTVLGADGRALAGEPALAAVAPALGAGGTPADGAWGEVSVRTGRGVVFGAWTAAHALIATAGPLSLTGPTALDMRAALAVLSPARERLAAAARVAGTPTGEAIVPPSSPPPPPPPTEPDTALRRAIDALDDVVWECVKSLENPQRAGFYARRRIRLWSAVRAA